MSERASERARFVPHVGRAAVAIGAALASTFLPVFDLVIPCL